MVGQTINYYDGLPFEGLSYRQIGAYGALVRTETLILTEQILQAAYPEVPPFLATAGLPGWSPEYPQEFRTLLKPLAGYSFYTGGANNEHFRGYFSTTRRRYDFHDPQGNRRGLLTVTRDPLGSDTTLAYDDYQLLPVQMTDPVGLVTRAVHDYRVLQPQEMTDPNSNRTHYAYTPLGLLRHTAIMGKAAELIGDTDVVPSTRFVYDFLAFDNSPEGARQPISVSTVRRVHHVNETDLDPVERDETIQTVEYSDGFGRLIQTRTQAEDITFGDTPFGDAGLPADQSAPIRDAIGHAPCSRWPSQRCGQRLADL